MRRITPVRPAAIALLLGASAAMLLGGCSSVRYVTVPQSRETVSHRSDTASRRDSIYVHDSVTVCMAGDTVRIQEYHVVYRDRWRERLRVDSFIRRDTVTVVKEVERPPGFWRRAKMRMAGALLLTAAIALLAVCTKFIIHKLSK